MLSAASTRLSVSSVNYSRLKLYGMGRALQVKVEGGIRTASPIFDYSPS
jgi:hypothetical protein